MNECGYDDGQEREEEKKCRITWDRQGQEADD